jgi:small nuclear ribonucleoprotein
MEEIFGKDKKDYKRALPWVDMVLPMEMLEKLLNSNVSLLLKDGRVVKGKLVGYDPYMNIVIDDAQESDGENLKRLGKIVLRGNGVISISQP